MLLNLINKELVMIKFLKSIFKKKTRTQIYVSSTASGMIFKNAFNTGIFNKI